MDQNKVEEAEGKRNGVELAKTAPDKRRPSSRYYSIFKADKITSKMVAQAVDAVDREKGKYTLIRDVEDFQMGAYDKPLPCFGCGIGWFSFLLGILCPLMWYYATILYFGNYYRKDPRERAGLAASAIAAMICSAIVLIILAFRLF